MQAHVCPRTVGELAPVLANPHKTHFVVHDVEAMCSCLDRFFAEQTLWTPTASMLTGVRAFIFPSSNSPAAKVPLLFLNISCCCSYTPQRARGQCGRWVLCSISMPWSLGIRAMCSSLTSKPETPERTPCTTQSASLTPSSSSMRVTRWGDEKEGWAVAMGLPT